MTDNFVHLRVHSEYSLVDGLVRIKPLVSTVRDAGMPAVALTEQCNLFSFVKFYRAAEAAGVKPLVGVDLGFPDEDNPETTFNTLLLCRNREGYRQLSNLVSRAYTEGQVRGTAMARLRWLDEFETDQLIALSGGAGGHLGKGLLSSSASEVERRVDFWRRRFENRFYVELQRTGRAYEEDYIALAVDLAVRADLPVVATNDVRFLSQDDFEAHEARVCIHQGRVLDDERRPKHYSDQQYLRSPAEMAALFSDLPEALENSVEIAKRCNLEVELNESYLPAFPVPDDSDESSWFVAEAERGLEQRLAALFDSQAPDFADIRERYHERLHTELDVIVSMGFAGYFLIVADFINWAKNNGVPVGPGRGSGAGSLVAYAMGITDLDPIDYDLLFERFLNPERVSLPDFDVDFCMDGRDRVIDYVTRRYGGNEFVSQIITFGTMAAKAVVRDCGRVLGFPYGFVDQIAKLVPFEIGMTLERAMKEEVLLQSRYDEEADVRVLLDLARKLEGIVRNAGKHAGGVVIAPTRLTDFTPLYCEQGSESVVTQLDKDDVESVGLVKFDFLGLRTLTIIDRAVHAVNERCGEDQAALDIMLIPLDDEPTYELIRACRTTAVFQFESRVMKDLTRRLQPVGFEDIIALNALIRPGPAQLADEFIGRKNGRLTIEYLHPELEVTLKPTYGVILYQEQVMQIAQILAGYTLGGADLLRRAMGKKKPEEMAKQREVFVDGARTRGVEESTASFIFDLMEKFAGYGFNKSHSAAYALLAYQTAWLKCHHAADFMSAVLSADMDNTDKVVTLIDECCDMSLEILPPDVNQCTYYFQAASDTSIRYGLGAIKGVGRAAIESIIAERGEHGEYRSLFDFCCRVDNKKINRRVLEALIKSGALDALAPTRSSMMSALGKATQAAEQHLRDKSAGQDDMFGGTAQPDREEFQVPSVAEWPEPERLSAEKDTLGLYLTGHPIKQYEDEIQGFIPAKLVDLKPTPGTTSVAAGLVVNVRTLSSRRGRMAIVTLDDRTARIEVVVYSDTYQQYRDVLNKDQVLIVQGEVTLDEVTGLCAITANALLDLDAARALYARRLLIRLDEQKLKNGFVGHLTRALEPYRNGVTPITIEYHRRDAHGLLKLGDAWKVTPTGALLDTLRGMGEAEWVGVEYT